MTAAIPAARTSARNPVYDPKKCTPPRKRATYPQYANSPSYRLGPPKRDSRGLTDVTEERRTASRNAQRGSSGAVIRQDGRPVASRAPVQPMMAKPARTPVVNALT